LELDQSRQSKEVLDSKLQDTTKQLESSKLDNGVLRQTLDKLTDTNNNQLHIISKLELQMEAFSKQILEAESREREIRKKEKEATEKLHDFEQKLVNLD
jgi:predicted  nucleic acid-binding Zn-ribbon protein